LRQAQLTSPKAIASWQKLAAQGRLNKGRKLPEAWCAAIARGKLGVLGTAHQREMKRGANNPLWKDGRPDSQSGSLAKNWSEAVKVRDNYTCQECGHQGARRAMHAHHIVPFKENRDLRFVVSNGLTLCAGCHNRKHPRDPWKNRRATAPQSSEETPPPP